MMISLINLLIAFLLVSQIAIVVQLYLFSRKLHKLNHKVRSLESDIHTLTNL